MKYQESHKSNTAFDKHVKDAMLIDMQGADPQYVTHDIHLKAILDDLHQRLNKGEDVQNEIDAHIPICLLKLNNHVLCDLVDVKTLVLSRQQTMQVGHLPDIGCFVRMIFTDCTSHSAFFKILHYSMPFIKHNRLSFPAQKDFSNAHLFDLMQITLHSLLGLFPTCTKKPLFYNRVLITGTIHTLLATADTQLLHTFCQNNLHIVRVAMMEYFLHFLEQNMPVEFALLQAMIHIDLSIHNIITQLRVCVDNFRQRALQQHFSSLESINVIAQQCNDRCNRICKGKFRYKRKQITPKRRCYVTSEALNLAMSSPKLPHKFYLHRQNSHMSHDCIAGAFCTQQSIQVFDMPNNLKQIQFKVLADMAQAHITAATRSIYLHFCLRCKLSERSSIDNMMRVDGKMKVFCNRCRECDHVMSINTLGRFIYIDKQVFFFCIECKKIHAWTPDGHGFRTTPSSFEVSTQCTPCTTQIASKNTKTKVYSQNTQSTQSTQSSSLKNNKCVLCYRTVNLNIIKLMHTQHVFFYDVYLCKWHMPLNNSLQFITTMSNLKQAMLAKQKYYAKKH